MRCKDARRSQLQEVATSAGALQRQLRLVLEIQNEYIEEKQLVIRV